MAVIFVPLERIVCCAYTRLSFFSFLLSSLLNRVLKGLGLHPDLLYFYGVL